MGKKHFSDIGDKGPHEGGGNIEDLGMTGGRREVPLWTPHCCGSWRSHRSWRSSCCRSLRGRSITTESIEESFTYALAGLGGDGDIFVHDALVDDTEDGETLVCRLVDHLITVTGALEGLVLGMTNSTGGIPWRRHPRGRTDNEEREDWRWRRLACGQWGTGTSAPYGRRARTTTVERAARSIRRVGQHNWPRRTWEGRWERRGQRTRRRRGDLDLSLRCASGIPMISFLEVSISVLQILGSPLEATEPKIS